MDQEDFEAQAFIGECPVCSVQRRPVIISAAEDSPARNDPPVNFNYDDNTGRISVNGVLPVDQFIYNGPAALVTHPGRTNSVSGLSASVPPSDV